MTWEPIDHKPPLPRIDLAPKRAAFPDGCRYPVCNCELRCFLPTPMTQAEQDRIWALVKGAAEGSNVRGAE